MTCPIRRGELITVIDPTFTSRTSTFQVETQDYDDGHDTQRFGQFNVLRWLPGKRSSLFKIDPISVIPSHPLTVTPSALSHTITLETRLKFLYQLVFPHACRSKHVPSAKHLPFTKTTMTTARGGSTGSPSIEITEICVSSQYILKSVQLSIGSFKRESPCLLDAKTHAFELSSPWQVPPFCNRSCLADAGLSTLEWSKSFDKFDVILKFSQYAGNLRRVATYNPQRMSYSSWSNEWCREIFPYQRMLRRQGCYEATSLSSQNPLLKLVLPQTVAHSKAGVSNINTPIIASENRRFVLHDSQGFEHGEGDNFKKVVDFLKARKDMPNVRDQVHAVWLCFQVSLSEGNRLFEAGVEELFRMKLVGQVEFGNNLKFQKRNKHLDAETRNACLAEEARAKFQELCIGPFEKVVDKNIPHIPVSTTKGYKDTRKMLNELVRLTTDYVKNTLAVDVAGDVALVSAIAQRVNPAVKIDAVIAVGKKRYWMDLAASAKFLGNTIEECQRVLHTDIVQVWNIQDDLIFGLVVNARLRLSRRLIKLVFTAYNISEERSKVHKEVKEHVKLAGCFDWDAALAKIIQLIKEYQMKPESMDKLQSAVEMFENNDDEDWGIGKA
ncbi:uncharacterized protein LACBIDRAFT_296016 [Laccaria bicolor S238N-H82]|uniref:Predicted protein n=1 Tax=Laccaria bicolor (strain S238N-H82 / ATCC MYA-4686) TaxID=486041 RepID=B0E1X8_LACBS|nr:uncharacterized protein LACBIDRAFT_296016 [Laccaria bicolor S238N-H82]EDQ99133.1 predicted protein [Laccaria bicolor S238N-H82]|eukprot:XP_001890196.1 predicted protein [Laccaria bicolor S238N-H82]